MNQGRTIYAPHLAALTIFLTYIGIATGGTVSPRMIEQKGFSIIGIEARTNNAREATGDGIIPKEWDKFFKEGILQKIPNKVDPTIFVIYTDYASDRHGEYTYVIGAKVNDDTAVPPGMVIKTVPKGSYAVLTTSKGPVQKIVPEAWQQIGDLEDKSQLGGPRAYKADFEVYDQRSQNPRDSQVDIYVGIK
jgi:predicted transcriptional regulator YdeE